MEEGHEVEADVVGREPSALDDVRRATDEPAERVGDDLLPACHVAGVQYQHRVPRPRARRQTRACDILLSRYLQKTFLETRTAI